MKAVRQHKAPPARRAAADPQSERGKDGLSMLGFRPPDFSLQASQVIQSKPNPQSRSSIIQREQTTGTDIVEEVRGDQIYETLAHEFAYKDQITVDEMVRLRQLGFFIPTIKHGALDFQMSVFRPNKIGRDKGYIPVLAFRGTEGFMDAFDDLNQSGVGMGQFGRNMELIDEQFEAVGGLADVTGHSLGGALAQMAAALNPNKTRKVITFQAPGIPDKFVKAIERYNKAVGPSMALNATHYRAAHDVVDDAGDAFIPGTSYDISFDQVSNEVVPQSELSAVGAAHTSFPLRRLMEMNRNNPSELSNVQVDRGAAAGSGSVRPIESLRQKLPEIFKDGLSIGDLGSVDNLLRDWINENTDQIAHLSADQAVLIIELLLTGYFSDADKEAILKLIKHLPKSQLPRVKERAMPIINDKL